MTVRNQFLSLGVFLFAVLHGKFKTFKQSYLFVESLKPIRVTGTSNLTLNFQYFDTFQISVFFQILKE